MIRGHGTILAIHDELLGFQTQKGCNMTGVTLQINLAPFDHRHAKDLLPHQIGTFDDGIDEIVLTYDEGKGKRRTPQWPAAHAAMCHIMKDLASKDARVSIRPVEYDDESIRRVSSYFCAAGQLPLYDFRGAPFYQYFCGLHAARNDLILHMDSDMFFGGGGQGWIKEARAILESDPTVLTVSPHPGPPHPDGKLRDQASEPYKTLSRSYVFKTVSTRVFLMDRRSLRKAIVAGLPGPLGIAWALYNHFPPRKCAECCISEAMRRAGRMRVDTLGSGQGVWSLHPLQRSESFYAGIQGIIARVKAMDIPEDQLGRYDFTESFFDWGDKIKSYK